MCVLTSIENRGWVGPHVAILREILDHDFRGARSVVLESSDNDIGGALGSLAGRCSRSEPVELSSLNQIGRQGFVERESDHDLGEGSIFVDALGAIKVSRFDQFVDELLIAVNAVLYIEKRVVMMVRGTKKANNVNYQLLT